MKKKIIFMIINMNIGGTEKALLNMISEIDNSKYDITLMMLEEYGGFLGEVPKWVKIKYLNKYEDIKPTINNPPISVARDLLKKGRIKESISITYLHLLSKITKERTLYFKYALSNYEMIDEDYDLAIAYAGPMDFISYFVANKIKAKKRIQWIHFDITKIGFNKEFACKIYEKFDKIFVVSKEAKEKLVNTLPELQNKTDVFYNILSSKAIVNMADRGIGFKDQFDGTRILTVGRLTNEKGQDLTIPVLSRLRKEKYNVRWYCIGEGNSRNRYERMIRNANVEDNYILLGAKSNPYSYMKECDIYVQPSRHEGYCITLAEAKCFKKPIIATDFTGVREHIDHKKNGLIVEFNEEDLYEHLKLLLDNNSVRKYISSNIQELDIDTKKEMNKLYDVI